VARWIGSSINLKLGLWRPSAATGAAFRGLGAGARRMVSARAEFDSHPWLASPPPTWLEFGTCLDKLWILMVGLLQQWEPGLGS